MTQGLFSMSGNNALVTGSTQGIGRALAEGLMRAGARVVLNGRTSEKVQTAVDECRKQGLSAEGVAFDVTDEGAVKAGIAEVTALVGQIDVLVNNAGGAARGPITEMSLANWRRIINLNLDSVFLVSREVIPDMITRKAGKIINTCSLMSRIARKDNANYAASKGGVAMFTKELAVELGPNNIQVNGIGPGYFITPLTEVLRRDEKFDLWLKGRTPMARWGNMDELVGAAVFLASPASDFVTGQIIYVDGGFTAAM
ncbi:MAG: SDR family oxidoreductase [Spirochaetales bacterium]|nr:SDR family oxidoreductase [Spirochaetales bacterium]